MRKRDMIIIAAALALALIAAVVSSRGLHRGGAEDMVDIKVDGQLYESVPLNEDQVIEIKQDNGAINHIEIKDGTVHMLDANCANQDCVRMGSMSAIHPGPRFGVIVCLPNRVSIELRLASEEKG